LSYDRAHVLEPVATTAPVMEESAL
jgi:hypothetical protein